MQGGASVSAGTNEYPAPSDSERTRSYKMSQPSAHFDAGDTIDEVLFTPRSAGPARNFYAAKGGVSADDVGTSTPSPSASSSARRPSRGFAIGKAIAGDALPLAGATFSGGGASFQPADTEVTNLDLRSRSGHYAQRCECGNVMMPDAHFCRKCGRRRLMRLRSDSWDYQGVIWQWSFRDRRACCCRLGRKGGSSGNHFRFLDREAEFQQSRGHWNIRRLASERDTSQGIRRLYLSDVYHSFMDIESVTLQFLVYTMAYMFCFVSFAFVYLAISDRCGLELNGSYLNAYFLSVETMVTIGYGVPDPYYNECYEGAIVLTIQSLVQYFLNAIVIGAIFVRLTRPQSRSATILFSDKAVIQQRKGAFYFMFQVCEAKHHDLLEAHVRCYCVRRDRKGDQKYATLPMRLQHPDDDRGSMMLMTLPQQIVHRIDHWSPLSPSWDSIQQSRQEAARCRRDAAGGNAARAGQPPEGSPSLVKENPLAPQPEFWGPDSWLEVPQRQADCDQGSRDSCVCPTCGESFQTLELLRRHTQYQAAQDAIGGVAPELRHAPWTLEDFQSWGWTLVEESHTHAESIQSVNGMRREVSSASFTMDGKEYATTSATREELQTFMTQHAHLEVLVLVEGIEPTTSSTIQARHSYLFPEDVAWNKQFVDCLRPGTADRPCAVDLSYFHELMPMGLDASERGSPMALPQSTLADASRNEEAEQL